MKIRRIEKKDRPALQTLLYAQNHFKVPEIQVALEIIDIALAQPNEGDYKILVATGDDEEILGYVCYGKAPMTDAVYDLYWIVVHPVFWNQGTGTSLLRYAEKDLMRRKARCLLIETSSLPPYESPRAFYLKHGYKEMARVADYYSIGDHKLIFGKTLVP
jgi:ribosomal protein S18 acetylase RimI-like enzyme